MMLKYERIKPRVYLEPTVVSHLVARSSDDAILASWQKASRRLWEDYADRFEFVVSRIVHAEIQRGDSIAVFFCYTPHHMFELHDLVILEEPAHDPDKWIVFQPTDDPNWLENSSAGVAWKNANLHIHYAKSLEESQPEAAEVLSNVKLSTDQVSAMVYAIIVEKMTLEDLASQWVEANMASVDEWMR